VILDEAARQLDDPIVAVATGDSRTAIGVIRLSGPSGSVDAVLAGCARLHHPAPLLPGRVRRFDLIDPDSGEDIDSGLLLRFVAPRSYTGEDVVEFSLHGNPVLLELGLAALQAAGARAAAPGEFTRRAVIHGKLSLIQAEAVAATIDAETKTAARLAKRHLGGELTRRIEDWSAQLLQSAAGLEAIIDFPEEVDEGELDESMRLLEESLREMMDLTASYSAGRSLVRGWSVVITGPVNAGKSTLFNRLLDQERAIVSPQAGTTRDTIAESVTWSGIGLRIQDTAGLRATEDPVELAGISRSESATTSADLVIEVRDGRQLNPGDSPPQTPAGERPFLWVATHGDLLSANRRLDLTGQGWLVVTEGEMAGVEDVRRSASKALTAGGPKDGMMIHTARQHHALRSASLHLREAVSHGLPEPVLSAFAIRAAIQSLEEFIGRWDNEEVLDVLFESFCIGK